jgi:DNA-binding response OmpR family regulator
MRILIVEDVARFANEIADGLRDQGMAVDVAYDGNEALTKLNLNPTKSSSSTATSPESTATRCAG